MKPTVTLFYDGLCPLCSREVANYRQLAPAEGMAFVDIANACFDARLHGLDPVAIHQAMHVKVGEQVRTGVDAFAAVWELLPPYRPLWRLARVPVFRWLMMIGYAFYARVRPWLPRRPTDCDSGTCRVSAVKNHFFSQLFFVAIQLTAVLCGHVGVWLVCLFFAP